MSTSSCVQIEKMKISQNEKNPIEPTVVATAT